MKKIKQESVQELNARISFIDKGVNSQVGKCLEVEVEDGDDRVCRNKNSHSNDWRRKNVLSYESKEVENDYVEFPFIL